MWYSIRMVFKRIRTSNISYLILSVQLAVGIAFIAYAANHLLSAKQMMQAVEKKVQESDIRIEPEMKGSLGKTEQPPITYSEYKVISRRMSGNTELNVYREEPSAIGGGSLYYLFTDAGGKHLDEEAVYVPQKLYNEIKAGSIEELSDFITFTDGQMMDSQTGYTYTVKNLPKYLEDEVAVVNSLENVMFSECIVFPLKGLNDRVFEYYSLTIQGDGIKNWHRKADSILKILEDSHGEYYQYMQQNPLKEQQYYCEHMTIMPRYLGKLAVVMLFVLIFGFSGILHLHVKRREKEHSVCIAMGARSSRICMELLLEISLVCVMGMVLGNLLCALIMKVKVFDSLFPVSYFPETVVLTIVITYVITFIVTLASVIKILKLEPAKLLQSL